MRRRGGRGWWRQNRWALVGFIVLFPLSMWLVFANGWFSYYETRPSRPHTVEAGVAEAWAGGEFTILTTELLSNGDSAGDDMISDLPARTELVVVTMRVVPPDAELLPGVSETPSPFYCSILLSAADGTGQWSAITSSDFGWRADEEAAAGGCDIERVDPYRVQSAFLVPADADDLRLRVVIVDQLPEYLELKLPSEDPA